MAFVKSLIPSSDKYPVSVGHPTLALWAGCRGEAQGHREYLGFLFSVLLIVRYLKQRGLFADSFQYQWINDNVGALQWASKRKCSSLASQMACMAVSQIHMLTHIYMEDPDHLPGVAMEEIDAMSRMVDGEKLDYDRIRIVCPSLTQDLQILEECVAYCRVYRTIIQVMSFILLVTEELNLV